MQKPYERGFTLVEVLAVVVVLAILFSLLLAAVSNVRETARRTECLNHLKQIGLGLSGYESTYRFFPAINSTSGFTADAGEFAAHYYSPLVRCLPYFDERSVYNACNLTLDCTKATVLIDNNTVMQTSLALFLCPSDGTRPNAGYAGNNYRFNTGITPWIAPVNSLPDSWTGPFTSYRFYAAAAFLDGLSNTIGASERCQGDWDDARFAAGGDYKLTTIGDEKIGGAERAIELCQSYTDVNVHESRSGENWFFSGFHYSCYNHCVTPNSAIKDCAFDDWKENWNTRFLHEGIFTARSMHGNGVNTLYMDGSARFIMNTINVSTWRALGTRSGNDN